MAVLSISAEPVITESCSIHPMQLSTLQIFLCRGNRTTNGPPVVWAFNSTLNGAWQPVTSAGTFRAIFTYNPSAIAGGGGLNLNNAFYFNVHTTKWPDGEIRGQFSHMKQKGKAGKQVSLSSTSDSTSCNCVTGCICVGPYDHAVDMSTCVMACSW